MPTGGSVNVAGSVVPSSDSTKLLGSILDSNIRVVLDATRTIAESRVGSRLDYAKFILYSASRKNIARVQRIQNVLARVVTCTRVNNYEPSRNSAPQTCNYSRFCALSPSSLLTASALPLH